MKHSHPLRAYPWLRLSVLFTTLLCGATGAPGQSRNLISFVTSVEGTADLSTWPDAQGLTGLLAADAICQARAAAAGLPNAGGFVAWLSDGTDDAYCRVHGLSGRKEENCEQGSLPTGAGPWLRIDGAPFGDTIERMLEPEGVVYTPARIDEFGAPVSRSYFTGTTEAGASDPDLTCEGWTTANPDLLVTIGRTELTTGSWTRGAASGCNSSRPLLCMEAGAGPSLPPRDPVGRLAFLASASGGGDLGSWPEAGGATGLAAGDAICRELADRAGLLEPDSFKAWLSNSDTDARDRLANDGAWRRVDNVPIAENLADLIDGELFAPINVTEQGLYRSVSSRAWTGTGSDGRRSSTTCEDWQSSDGSVDTFRGIVNAVSDIWTGTSSNFNECNRQSHLYCFSDAATSDCLPSANRLCLGAAGRFGVEMQWQDFDGNTAAARTFDIGKRDSGLFYFNRDDNIEVLIKVLDACSLNDHFWVFFAATTNVAFTLTVTDTETGAAREYRNGLGMTAEPVQDSEAFPCASP